MSKRYNKRIDNSEPLKRYFWSLIMIVVFCLFSYGYLVRGAIVNIVERQNAEQALSEVNSRVLTLEAEYFKVKNSITLDLATDLGFITPVSQKFVTKNPDHPGLSLVTPGL
jgi:hypothetical protein